MMKPIEPVLQIPDSVVADVKGFRARVEEHRAGETNAVAFRAYRVPMGIYEQRVDGRFMVRARVPAGILLAGQADIVADLSRRYGDGVLHLTTRQDIQIHAVPIEGLADVMEGLLPAGLTARGGGGNTVRNVSACPHSGLSGEGAFDVVPHAVAVAEYLLQLTSSYNLPRKYKIAFSCCEADGAFASVADLGFFAKVKDGRRGFSVYSGGGLGPHPRLSLLLEAFVEEHEIFVVAEAMKRLFDAHGDRANKHKARLRYVAERLGAEGFRSGYAEFKAALLREGLPGEIPTLRSFDRFYAGRQGVEYSGKQPAHVHAEVRAGFYTVSLTPHLGDIPAETLKQLAGIAETDGVGILRITQSQGLLIPGVSGARLDAVLAKLGQLDRAVGIVRPPAIVACTGASTCKLGLCLSRGLGAAIRERLDAAGVALPKPDFTIRISGCPNSCSDHYLADLGFEGRAKRVGERMMPYYDVLAGAVLREGGTRLAERLGSVPARRIPEFVADVMAEGSLDPAVLRRKIEVHAALPADVPEIYYHDFGVDAPFSLAGRGPGECGSGVMDVVKLDLDEARDLIARPDAGTDPDVLYRAALRAARALLVIFGVEKKKDREIVDAFDEYLVKPGWVLTETRGLLNAALDWKLSDPKALNGRLCEVTTLVHRIAELFASLDASLKFRVAPYAPADTATPAATAVHKLDLRGVGCPMNFVKAKVQLERIPVGDVLEVLLDDGAPVRNVPQSFADQGQAVLSIEADGTHHRVRIQRKK